MSNTTRFHIQEFPFNKDILNRLDEIHFSRDHWPVIYILTGDGYAYVGETKDLFTRLSKHLTHSLKKKLTNIYIISSHLFHKSATLDIEANLIKYLSGDQQFKLLNANIGLEEHNFFQKQEVYQPLFESIWKKLIKLGIAVNSTNFIKNEDIFKYSPYKELSTDQAKSLLGIMKNLLNDKNRNTIVDGRPGTGKTILAIFLFKLMHTDIEAFNFASFGSEELEFIETVKSLKQKYPSPKMALVIPVTSFRGTIEKVFHQIEGLDRSMVVGPTAITKKKYDIVFVDESHRLRNGPSGAYRTDFETGCKKLELDPLNSTELDWFLHNAQTKKLVLFYDSNQRVRSTDVLPEDFLLLASQKDITSNYTLTSQMRLKGGVKYVNYVHNLLKCSLKPATAIFASSDYDFQLFESIDEFVAKIKSREKEKKLSRLSAGYAWAWVSKKDPAKFDILIEGFKLKWNSQLKDWINSKNAINEVGCIHTVQGYDLNYAGVIFGNEITYDKSKNEIVVRQEHYHDSNGGRKIESTVILKEFIINIYLTLLQRGILGTYVYVCDPALRDYFSRHIKKAVKLHPISLKTRKVQVK
ncbi:DNA/RNA helicase domain-containing protein [Chitinophaga sancti]|uniref:DNA/RNA helicase domain-containing protein n=1 Tax=Chitinophaga sancti TaxID=1004 RepID=UPI002A74E408|nr:DNA/RNA helicase domain-containing protein [Chitinophaga sancti]WPQ63267.1 DNA/RNA helicase domain-containing protein [Chitinophaga sancti]